MTSQCRHLAYWHCGKQCHVTGHYLGLRLTVFICQCVYMCVCVYILCICCIEIGSAAQREIVYLFSCFCKISEMLLVLRKVVCSHSHSCFVLFFLIYYFHQFVCDSGWSHNQSVLQFQDQVRSIAAGWWPDT